MQRRKTCSFMVRLAICSALTLSFADASERVLECNRTFPPDINVEVLAETHGQENVTAAEVALGEGFTETGTVLFAGTNHQIDIVWKDSANKAHPKIVRVPAHAASWRTPEGVTIGTALHALEDANSRPFRLAGFAFDYAGTVTSWNGGDMARKRDDRCWLRARLNLVPPAIPPSRQWLEVAAQVSGDRDFVSNHEAMQKLNPKVYELWLEY